MNREIRYGRDIPDLKYAYECPKHRGILYSFKGPAYCQICHQNVYARPQEFYDYIDGKTPYDPPEGAIPYGSFFKDQSGD